MELKKIYSSLIEDQIKEVGDLLKKENIDFEIKNESLDEHVYLSMGKSRNFSILVSSQDYKKAEGLLDAHGFLSSIPDEKTNNTKKRDYGSLSLKSSIVGLILIPIILNLVSFYYILKALSNNENIKKTKLITASLINIISLSSWSYFIYFLTLSTPYERLDLKKIKNLIVNEKFIIDEAKIGETGTRLLKKLRDRNPTKVLYLESEGRDNGEVSYYYEIIKIFSKSNKTYEYFTVGLSHYRNAFTVGIKVVKVIDSEIQYELSQVGNLGDDYSLYDILLKEMVYNPKNKMMILSAFLNNKKLKSKSKKLESSPLDTHIRSSFISFEERLNLKGEGYWSFDEPFYLLDNSVEIVNTSMANIWDFTLGKKVNGKLTDYMSNGDECTYKKSLSSVYSEISCKSGYREETIDRESWLNGYNSPISLEMNK